MKSTLLKSLLLATGALGALLAFNPAASAQDVSEFSRQQASANGAPPAGMLPGIRYTTGAVTTAGWERTLTEGDPNLKRWNWSAMTSYTQTSYNKVAPGAYVKKINNGTTPALKPAGSIYVKPIQVSPELYAKKRVQPGVIVVGNTNNTSSVSGRVRFPRTNQIAAVAPVAKGYNNYCNGTISVPDSDAFANRNVTGRLMRTQ